MVRQTLLLAAVLSLAACSASTSIFPTAQRSDNERAQLAAYAMTAKYPTDMKPTMDAGIGVTLNHNNNSLMIVNYSDRGFDDAKVWINASFVKSVSSLPPHSSVTIPYADFYDSTGTSMNQVRTTPTRVELQSRDHLFSLGIAAAQ